jgi:hypothetical protein
MDLKASMPELLVRATAVRGNPLVVKTVKHIPEQGRKAGTVQPIVTEPSVGLEGGVGVVIHLSTTRKKRTIISPIEQRQQPELKRNHHDNTSTQILTQTDDNPAKLSCVKMVQNLENYLIPK